MLYGMASEDTYAYTARTGTKCLLGTDGPCTPPATPRPLHPRAHFLSTRSRARLASEAWGAHKGGCDFIAASRDVHRAHGDGLSAALCALGSR